MYRQRQLWLHLRAISFFDALVTLTQLHIQRIFTLWICTYASRFTLSHLAHDTLWLLGVRIYYFTTTHPLAFNVHCSPFICLPVIRSEPYRQPGPDAGCAVPGIDLLCVVICKPLSLSEWAKFPPCEREKLLQAPSLSVGRNSTHLVRLISALA